MAVEDMAKALMRMSDRDVRGAVAGGDFRQFDELDLTKEETRLLVHAARGGSEDEDDVDGFGAFAPPYVPMGPVVSLMGAIRHVEDNLGASPVRGEFEQWTAKIGAQGTW